jgi:hypothetical protein
MPDPILVPLEKICLSGNTQPRAAMSGETVKEYAEAYEADEPLPPVDLFLDGERYWPADGRHRISARESAGFKDVPAKVHKGGERDAMLFAVGCNAQHGLRRTNDDKRHAVLLLLGDPEWGDKSSHAVAEKCRVSHTFVDNVRLSTGNVASSANGTRVGKDGKARRRPKRQKTSDEGELIPELAKRTFLPRAVRKLKALTRAQQADFARYLDQGKNFREAMKALKQQREPGDDTESEKAARKAHRENGKPVFDWNTFKAAWGALYRQIDALGNACRCNNSKGTEELQEHLKEFKGKFAELYEQQAKQKAPEDL